MVKKKGYNLWLIITIVLTISAISTLVPVATASKPCYLGYNANCTFTPISTVMLLGLAGLVCVYRKRKFTEEG